MRIFVAHSMHVSAEGSWILRQLESAEYAEQGVEPVYDLGGVDNPVNDQLLEEADAFVAEWSAPDAEQARKVMLARGMGKSVLAFLPHNGKLTDYLPDYQGREFEGNTSSFYIDDDSPEGILAVYRGGYREMKLKLWVGYQLLQGRLHMVSPDERQKVAAEWEAETNQV